jgi:hypothetical protein
MRRALSARHVDQACDAASSQCVHGVAGALATVTGAGSGTGGIGGRCARADAKGARTPLIGEAKAGVSVVQAALDMANSRADGYVVLVCWSL